MARLTNAASSTSQATPTAPSLSANFARPSPRDTASLSHSYFHHQQFAHHPPQLKHLESMQHHRQHPAHLHQPQTPYALPHQAPPQPQLYQQPQQPQQPQQHQRHRSGMPPSAAPRNTTTTQAQSQAQAQAQSTQQQSSSAAADPPKRKRGRPRLNITDAERARRAREQQAAWRREHRRRKAEREAAVKARHEGPQSQADAVNGGNADAQQQNQHVQHQGQAQYHHAQHQQVVDVAGEDEVDEEEQRARRTKRQKQQPAQQPAQQQRGKGCGAASMGHSPFYGSSGPTGTGTAGAGSWGHQEGAATGGGVLLNVPASMGGYQQTQVMGGTAEGNNANNAGNYLGFSAASIPTPQQQHQPQPSRDHAQHQHQHAHQQHQHTVHSTSNNLGSGPTGSSLPIWRDIDVNLPVAGDLKVRTEAAEFVWSGKVPGRLRVVFEPIGQSSRTGTPNLGGDGGGDADAERDADGVVVDTEDEDVDVGAANGVVVQWSSVNGV